MPFLNPYAERLGEFSAFAFNEPDIDRFSRHAGRDGWGDFFSRRMGAAPERVIVEIGCSYGVFLSEVAVAHPRAAFVGIDWKYKALYKAAKRVDTLKLSNVALIRARAQELDRIFGEGDLDELWVFFPDPWAKKSQLKHRLLQEAFLVSAARALKAGGRLLVKTDHPGYFQWVLALLGAPVPPLREYSAVAPLERSYRARQIQVRRIEKPDELPGSSETVRALFSLGGCSADLWGDAARPRTLFGETRTQFEKAFVEQGLPIYYLELTRSAQKTTQPPEPNPGFRRPL